MATYFEDSIGFVGANVIRFGQILEFARTYRRFLVAYGDWNMTPKQISEGADLDGLGLEVVAPSNATETCLAGKGRLTTFFIIARELRTMVKSCTAFEGTWGTHLGVQLSLATSMADVKYTSWQKPLRFKSYDIVVDEGLWLDAKANYINKHGEGISGRRVVGASFFDIKEGYIGTQERLGSRYAVWAGTVEHLLLLHNNIPAQAPGVHGQSELPDGCHQKLRRPSSHHQHT